jgi:hypothetical protein
MQEPARLGAQRKYHNLMAVLLPISSPACHRWRATQPARNIPVEFLFLWLAVF